MPTFPEQSSVGTTERIFWVGATPTIAQVSFASTDASRCVLARQGPLVSQIRATLPSGHSGRGWKRRDHCGPFLVGGVVCLGHHFLEPKQQPLQHPLQIPIKGGMTIPKIATFDHGTHV